MRIANLLKLLAVTVVVGGCATQDKLSGSILPDSAKGSYRVEESIEDAALKEIQATPTRFSVSYGDDRYSWERAQLFFGKYITHGKPPLTKIVGKNWTLSNATTQQGKYNFTVQKIEASKNYEYVVGCTARVGGDTRTAELNARNFARFIRDGKLEVSLLDR